MEQVFGHEGKVIGQTPKVLEQPRTSLNNDESIYENVVSNKNIFLFTCKMRRDLSFRF